MRCDGFCSRTVDRLAPKRYICALSLPTTFVVRGTLLVDGGYMRIMHLCLSIPAACFYVIG